MNYEEDFVNEEIVTLTVDDKKFRYKPTTAEDENNWLNDCITINPETKKPITNWAAYNKCKCRNIVGVPYDKERINKMTGVDKEWKDLTTDEQWMLFGKLNPKTFEKLTNAMKQCDEPDESVKKN